MWWMDLLMNPTFVVSIIVIAIFCLLLKKWKAGGKVPEEWMKRNLEGKTVVITGANTGIGLVVAKEFAKMHATVIVAARDTNRGREAVMKIKEYSKSDDVVFIALDLNDLSSIRHFVKRVENEDIHYLINNAGVMFCPHNVTKDGFEYQFGVNHLGHMYLTMLLIENLKKNKARVITVSSIGHNICTKLDLENIKGKCEMHNRLYLYGRSKLANILFAKELQRRYSADGIISYSLHPGNVMTELARHISILDRPTKWVQPLFMKTPWEGAQTTLFAALCDPNEVPNGSYLSDCAIKKPNSMADDIELQKKLWEVSEKVLGLN